MIENYQQLKDELMQDGEHHFTSETDTEVLAHLIGKLYEASSRIGVTDPRRRQSRSLSRRVRDGACNRSSALTASRWSRDMPDFIVGARRGSPLVLGVGKDENFLASDVSAIVAYTRDAVYLNDFDVVAVERDKFEISSVARRSAAAYEVSKVEFTDEDIKKGDYPHYMLKEIFEQPGRCATRCAAGSAARNAPPSSAA